MSLSFDLSSVLQLLGSLPADSSNNKKLPSLPSDTDSSSPAAAAATTTTTTTTTAPPTTKDTPSDDVERRLGDFSFLWSFLSSSKFVPTPICLVDGHGVRDNDNDHTGHLHDGEQRLTEPTKIKAILRRPDPAVISHRSNVSQKGPDVKDLNQANIAAAAPTAASTPTPKTTKKKPKASKLYSAVAPPPTFATPKKLPEKTLLQTSKAARPTIRSTIPSEQRKLSIVQKLLARFPQDNKTLLKPAVHDGHSHPGDLHIFVDNSNILISFADYIKETRGFHKFDLVRRPSLSFHGLSLVLERGRRVTRRVLAGSSPVTKEIVEAGDLGYETCILDRVEKEVTPEKDSSSSASSGSETSVSRKKTKYVEQGVDELLHMKMLESIIDYEPSTVVLASGDGAPAEFSMGFFHVILRYLTLGWRVEVVAFRKNLNKNYRDVAFRRKWGDKFKLILLDEYAEELLM